MKCDGEKGNPSDVEGVGSISIDLARGTDGLSAHGRRCACASATAGRLAPRDDLIAASCHGPRRGSGTLRGGESRSVASNGTMRSLIHVDVPPGRTALF